MTRDAKFYIIHEWILVCGRIGAPWLTARGVERAQRDSEEGQRDSISPLVTHGAFQGTRVYNRTLLLKNAQISNWRSLFKGLSSYPSRLWDHQRAPSQNPAPTLTQLSLYPVGTTANKAGCSVLLSQQASYVHSRPI